MHGKVKWFGPARGYGFLIADDKKEYFVHYADINMTGYKTLTEGQEVTFTLKDTPKGKAAADVIVVNP